MARNAVQVKLGPLELFFSFTNCVGFGVTPLNERGRAIGPTEFFFSDNVWTNATGKHITMFRQATGARANPLPHEEFRGHLKALAAALGLAETPIAHFY